jgi:late competence protein required for DNA uptake (superfamily II DNA/RNA helicase)
MEKAIEFSNKIWEAIQKGDVQFLTENVHQDAHFVHMGVTLTRDGEIDVIKTGNIIYKDIDFQEVTVKSMASTVVVLNKMKLTAIVGGNEVVNPFVVTEVYTHIDDVLKLASLSFTKIVY